MANGDAMQHAIEVLREGGVVAFPTDTLYGLAVDPRSADAVQRLFAIKGREAGHAIPLIAATVEQAGRAAIFDERATRVAAAFWPGPLSIVLPAREGIREEILGAGRSVALRVPAHPVARELCERFGFCLTATSANMSGKAPTASPRVVADTLGGLVDHVLDAGDSPGGQPSTIVDLCGAEPRLVRPGAIAWERVLRSIQ
ncbi:MAG TPA: L-threonylcarbamoyladenylate synthase [Vicinamibacterales bacterium]